MRVNFCQNSSTENLKAALSARWPEAVRCLNHREGMYFATGLIELDRIFTAGRGIPCGQLIEITGGPTSGKTSLLHHLLAVSLSDRRRAAYVDFNDSFFPDSERFFSESEISHLLVIRPPAKDTAVDPLKSGLRTAELLLRDRRADIVVFDLIGRRRPLPLGLLHRLRLKTVRARGMIIFLTQAARHSEPGATPAVIPSSMSALRFEVTRPDPSVPDRLELTVTKSRLCSEGLRLRVRL